MPNDSKMNLTKKFKNDYFLSSVIHQLIEKLKNFFLKDLHFNDVILICLGKMYEYNYKKYLLYMTCSNINHTFKLNCLLANFQIFFPFLFMNF